MDCPFCNAGSKVVDSRPIPEGIRRRRECLRCGRRFTTHERVVPLEVRVTKAGNRSPEDFEPEKIAVAMQRVCKGRPVSRLQIDDAVRRLEAILGSAARSSIASLEIAQLVADQLQELDQVAHLRFLTNYLDTNGRVRLREELPPDKTLVVQEQLKLF